MFRRDPSRPTPLWAVMLFTFANSIGTGLVTSGIFFITKVGYQFSQLENYLLGLVLGVTYIAGALGAKPALNAARRVFPGLTSRRVLAGLMIVLTLLCALPFIMKSITPPVAGERPPVWPIWVMVTIYSPLTGVLWPLVESYLSGPRSGQALRTALGWWNVVWSSALVVAYIGAAPLLKEQAALSVLLLGMVHIAAAGLLVVFRREPLHESDAPREDHPDAYAKLLITFRWLLPLSYLVSSTLNPFLPSALETLRVDTQWQTIVASAWLLPRCIAFWAYRQFPGWHGRWWMPACGCAGLLVGFAATVLAPQIADRTAGLATLIAGLSVFGCGMATIYAGAIYYALEVGHAEVEAGGMHEALIGVGYTVGPGLGAIAAWAVSEGELKPSGFQPLVLGTVGTVTVLVILLVIVQIRRYSRTHPAPHARTAP